MKCNNCGREISDVSKFCTGCGEKLDVSSGQPPAYPVQAGLPQSTCPQCGKPVKAGNKFCTGCGFVLGSAPNVPPQAGYRSPAPATVASNAVNPVAPHKKNKTGVIATVCAAVLVAAGGITVWLVQQQNGATVPAAEASTASVEDVSELSRAPDEPYASDNPDTPAEPTFIAQMAINPKYDALNGGFDDYGRARVKMGDAWHLIDQSGNILTDYDYEAINFFYEDFAVVIRDGKYGYIDTDGNEVIPAQFARAFSFSEDVARIGNTNAFGFIDKSGKIIITPRLANAKGASDGFILLGVDSETSTTFFISLADLLKQNVPVNDAEHLQILLSSGEIFSSPLYEEANSFSESLAAVRQADKWGYVDTGFNMVISPQFDAATAFEDGLAIVEQGGKQFFIDTHGNRFSPECDQVWGFSEGYATAMLGDKYGFISRETGEFDIPPEYTDIWAFTNGLAPVTEGNGRWFYINTQNEPQFDGKTWQEAHKFNGEYAKIRESGKWGFIDTAGNEIVPAEWDDAHLYTGGMIGVCRDGKWGFLEVVSE